MAAVESDGEPASSGKVREKQHMQAPFIMPRGDCSDVLFGFFDDKCGTLLEGREAREGEKRPEGSGSRCARTQSLVLWQEGSRSARKQPLVLSLALWKYMLPLV
jgi:hypothetical protein